MSTLTSSRQVPSVEECQSSLGAIGDALYVIGGKWKLRIISAMAHNRPMRFNELQRTIHGISARVLSNELKDLELNGFVKRNVYTQKPVIVEYALTEYSGSLGDILLALREWGIRHKEKIRQEYRNEQERATSRRTENIPVN